VAVENGASPVPQARENPVYQLNTAFLADGAVIAVAPGAKPVRPVSPWVSASLSGTTRTPSGRLSRSDSSRTRWPFTNPVYQLNTAFLADGAVIAVAPGAKPVRPVHLRFVFG
jgi:Fe-S cluster assembly scaffold protein SufB